jgi:hypothetical protein
MAVLHSTTNQKPAPTTRPYEDFGNIFKSYPSVKLFKSNWAIKTDEPPKAVFSFFFEVQFIAAVTAFKLLASLFPFAYLVT